MPTNGDVGEDGSPFCERCGSATPLSGPAGASFCLGCRLYLCAACSLQGELRCAACRASNTRPAVTGIGGARDALEVLREVERDARALADSHAAGAALDPEGAAWLQEFEILEIKRRSAHVAADHALDTTRPQHRVRAGELRDQLARTLVRIELAAAELRQTDDEGQAAWPVVQARGARRNVSLTIAGIAAAPAVAAARILPARGTRRTVSIAIAGIAAAAAVAAALILWPNRPPAASPVGEAPTATPMVRGGIAGAAGTTGPSPTSTATPSAREDFSFDQLEMGSAPPEAFTVRGPDGALTVAAFPSAVDRSLRLRATEAPSALCHHLSGAPSQVAARVRLEGTLLSGSVLVELAGADGSQLVAAVLTDSRALELHGSGHVLIASNLSGGRWYELTLTLDPAGEAMLVADGEDGAELGSAALPLDDRVNAQEVCFGLPAGEAVTELYIDDLEITY